MDKKYAEYLLTKTKEDYELTAKEFSGTRKKEWPEVRFLFDDYLKKGDKVLDLGCGNGRFYNFFIKNKVNLKGIDWSEKLINFAKKEYPKGNFLVVNALDMPFNNGYFDKIYAIAVLHHIPSEENRLKFFKEVKRVLKRRGVFMLTVWNFHTTKDFFLLLKYTILKIIGRSKLDFKDIFKKWGRKAEKYYHWFSKKELISLATKAGFKVKKSGIIKNKAGNRQNIYLIVETNVS